MAAQAGKIYIGIGGWNYAPWRGVFYPKASPQAKELGYAASHLTSIEINATFYGSQKPESFRKWASYGARRLCSFRSRDRALPPTGASSPRPAIPSSGFSIPACSNCATGSGRCSGSSRRPKSSTPPISESFSNCCRRKPTAGSCATSWKCATQVFARRNLLRYCGKFDIPVVFTDHATYPSLADVTGDFVYARLQQGQDAIPTAYPPKELDAWTGRLQMWAQGKEPDDLPRVEPATGAQEGRAARCFRLRHPRRQNSRAGGGDGADRAIEEGKRIASGEGEEQQIPFAISLFANSLERNRFRLNRLAL